MRKVSKIEPISPSLPTRKKVAGYARVSVESERLNHSLSAQVSYYSNLIQSNPEWEYAGVYADNAVTGTKASGREEFRRMLNDCEAGKIDIILTKSISRFARNTVDLLETVRHLKELGIDVRFEKERINSLSGDGEVMLTLLASFAQEEVRSLSENVKWGTRKRFEKGIPNGRFSIYGYRWEDDHLVVEPEEAKIVRLIYDNFLKGLSAEATEKQLEEMGVKSYTGTHFPNSSIRAILKNITYTGNLLFQKEHTLDPISKKTRKNHGELPQYWVEDTHEAIIPMETYQAVQAEIARRRELGALANWSINTSCFTSKIKCGLCGASFVRNTRKNRAKISQLGERYTFYGCGSNKKGGHCKCGTIRETVLKEECAKVLGLPEFDEDVFSERVAKITIPVTGTMLFEFTDGTSLEHHWYRNARKESWTPELRQAASEYRRDRDTGWKCYHTFTHFIKCGRCGANYRCQTHRRVDGTVVRSWYCSAPTSVGCSKVGIREDILRELIADVLGLPEFDEELFNQQLAYATVPADNEIVFHFRDGHEISRTFVQKRQMPRQTEERKKHMSEVMKEKWRERHAKND